MFRIVDLEEEQMSKVNAEQGKEICHFSYSITFITAVAYKRVLTRRIILTPKDTF